jgi:uncharacterized protein (DUF4415 family)
MSKQALTNDEGEVRELDAEDFASMRPLAEVLPELAAALPKRRPGQRGPAKKPPKAHVSLRLDPELVELYRSRGIGWQRAINDDLRKLNRDALNSRAARPRASAKPAGQSAANRRKPAGGRI